VEPAEEGEVEPAEDIPRIKRQRTTKEEEDLNCPENLEKNTDVMFPPYDDRTGRTEGTEEDEEDEEESEESYDSRNSSRRSSQQELGNSDDSQATEPLRHSQLEVIRGLQSEPVEDVEDVEGDSDADTNVPIGCPLITSAVHSAVAAVIPQAGPVVRDGPFFTNTELEEMTGEGYSDSGEDQDWTYTVWRASYVHAPTA